MRRLRNAFLKGLATVLPVVLTIYLVWWLGVNAEAVLGGWLRAVLPEHWYFPGLGLVVSFLLVVIAGLLVQAYIVQLPAGDQGRDLKRVVLWRVGSARLIGFVTDERIHPRMLAQPEPDIVPVYFPMSYQIGGYTLYLPKSELEETQLSVEEAMRLVLIGGVTASAASQETESP
jgi:uncharacterized membrane protein